MPAKKKSRKPASVVRSQATKSVARTKTRKPVPRVSAKATRLSEQSILESLRLGRERAEKILRDRAEALRSRTMGFVGGAGGLLIFEGDSWFDYPAGTDIRQELDDMNYDVESDAHFGDRIEEMVGQLHALQRLIERQTGTPKAVLLSGGGNDIVQNDKKQFLKLLNPANSANPGWNEDGLVKRIDGDLKRFYLEMLASITEFCRSKWGTTIPILIHGYGNPVPDGTPAPFKGPWLQPVFKKQGYVDDTGEVDLEICTPLAAKLIERFNTMLQKLPTAAPGLDHVHYVDLRPALSSGADYKDFWENELHPTQRGFKQVTRLIAAKLSALGGLI